MASWGRRINSAEGVVALNLILNGMLTTAKAGTALISGSMALLAEAIHSLGDMSASLALLLAIRVSKRPPDRSHPFGHGKIESLATLGTGIFLGYLGVSFLRACLEGLAQGHRVPGILALWVAAFSGIVKEAMYRYSQNAASRFNSSALMADACHHRADAIITAGAILGIAAARIGLPVMDALAGVAIAILVLKVGLDLILKGADHLLDGSPPDQEIGRVLEAASGVPRVLAVRGVRGRRYGSELHVDMDIDVEGSLSVSEVYHIAQEVKREVRSQLPYVSEVMIHIDPGDVAGYNASLKAGGKAHVESRY